MGEPIPPDFQVPGFLAAGISAGIKKNQEKDLALIYSEVPAVAAGVFTTNRVKAAPVLLSMERIKSGTRQGSADQFRVRQCLYGKAGPAGRTASFRTDCFLSEESTRPVFFWPPRG